MLLSKNTTPSKHLLELAGRHGIDLKKEISVEELLEKIQQHWLRKVSRQYEISHVMPELPNKKDLSIFKKLHLIDAITPPPGEYEGALLLGATANAVRRRIAFLLKQKVKFKKLYVLGSHRILKPEHEGPDILFKPIPELPFKTDYQIPITYENLPKTEAQMMRLVCEQVSLPKEWEIIFIDTLLNQNSDSKTLQPNTTDTLRDFSNLDPVPGKYLLVSNQPFVTRQTFNALSILPPEFTIVGIGDTALSATPLRTFLDEIGRLLYEELKYQHQFSLSEKSK